MIPAAVAQSPSKGADLSKEWPTYGHDPGGMRFSPLTEINSSNVSRLKVAWVYHMKPTGVTAPVVRPPAANTGGAVGDEVPMARLGCEARAA